MIRMDLSYLSLMPEDYVAVSVTELAGLRYQSHMWLPHTNKAGVLAGDR